MNWKIRVWLGWTEWHWRRRGRWSPPTLFSWRSVPWNSWKRSQLAIKRWRSPCLFPTLCVASTATSLDTWANVARLLRSVWVVEKISMKVNVRDPSCALIAMVPMLHQLKIAWSGRRRRRFNMSALRNAYPFWKPDSWLKPECRLWSLEVRPAASTSRESKSVHCQTSLTRVFSDRPLRTTESNVRSSGRPGSVLTGTQASSRLSRMVLADAWVPLRVR